MFSKNSNKSLLDKSVHYQDVINYEFSRLVCENFPSKYDKTTRIKSEACTSKINQDGGCDITPFNLILRPPADMTTKAVPKMVMIAEFSCIPISIPAAHPLHRLQPPVTKYFSHNPVDNPLK